MNTSIDRTNTAAIMKRLPLERQIAFKSWLKRWHGNSWMKDQDGWRQRAGLIASSELASDIFNIRRVLYCGRHGLFCGSANHCVRCCLDDRIQPAINEYGFCFKSDRFWYPMVINTRVFADQAGVEFGDLKSYPYHGQPDGHPILTGPAFEPYFEQLCRAFFALPALLKDRGVITGAFSHLEFHLSIRPGHSNYDCWSDLTHELQPHLNVVFNAPAPITPEVAQALHKAFGWLLMQHQAQRGYPNLWIGRAIRDQQSLNRWLAYILKPWPTDLWYRRALKRGCNPNHLNLLFDENVFLNLNHLARRAVSPRKIGNLNCQSLRFGHPYIGNQPPKNLSQPQISLWLKDPNFAARHPDWEDSIYQLIQKKWQRRGDRSSGRE